MGPEPNTAIPTYSLLELREINRITLAAASERFGGAVACPL